MAQQIITLTTDWGTSDHYVAAVKGKLHSLAQNEICIVDVSHTIQSLNVFEAAFVLKNCMDFFPQGTIHIIGVRSGASPNTPHVVVCRQGSFFIGADNGLFPLLFDDHDRVVEIDMFQDSDFFSFPTRDVFVKAAVHIANGKDPGLLGPDQDSLNNDVGIFSPADGKDSISGVVIHIDHYGNIISNIDAEKFRTVLKGRKFTISFGSYEIHEMSESYMDVDDGDLLALFNTSGLLEIAQNNGHAANILGIRFNDIVRIVADE
jgi:S-adenosyl-L-methionine hydrolase (adenosine-forming)